MNAGLPVILEEHIDDGSGVEMGSFWDDLIDFGSRFDPTLRSDLGPLSKATGLMNLLDAGRSLVGCLASL